MRLNKIKIYVIKSSRNVTIHWTNITENEFCARFDSFTWLQERECDRNGHGGSQRNVGGGWRWAKGEKRGHL